MACVTAEMESLPLEVACVAAEMESIRLEMTSVALRLENKGEIISLPYAVANLGVGS